MLHEHLLCAPEQSLFSHDLTCPRKLEPRLLLRVHLQLSVFDRVVRVLFVRLEARTVRVVNKAVRYDATWHGTHSLECQVRHRKITRAIQGRSYLGVLTMAYAWNFRLFPIDSGICASCCYAVLIANDNLLDRVAVFVVTCGWIERRRDVIAKFRVNIPDLLDLFLKAD